MTEELHVYVLDKLGNNYLGLTKEQTYAAIKQMIETGQVPADVDDGFITKLQEMNKKGVLQFWIGTMAEFQSIETKSENTLYLFTDDPTVDDIETAITQLEESTENSLIDINKRLTELGFKQGVATWDASFSFNPSSNTLTKEGNRVIFEFIDSNFKTNAMGNFGLLNIPAEFRPKSEITVTGRTTVQIGSGTFDVAVDVTIYPEEQVLADITHTARFLILAPAGTTLVGGIKILNAGWEV